MGISIVILFHVAFYALLAGLFSSIAARHIRSMAAPCSRLRVWIFRIAPFIVAGIPFALFLGSLRWNHIAPPSYLYSQVLGLSPGQEIKGLRGYAEGLNDSREIFLAFEESDAALNSILASAPFTSKEAAQDRDLSALPKMYPSPSWWRADDCPGKTVYRDINPGGWDTIVITKCDSDKTIYVHAQWLD